MTPVLLRPDAVTNAHAEQEKDLQANSHGSDDIIGYIQPRVFSGGGDGFDLGLQNADGSQATVAIDTRHGSIERLAVPLHGGCLEAASHFCHYQSRFQSEFRGIEGGEPSTMSHLYQIWKQRIIMSDTQLNGTGTGGVFASPIKEQHSYFGVPSYNNSLREYMEWLNEDPTEHSEKFLAAPHHFRDMTLFIVVGNLRRIPAGEKHPAPGLASLAAKLEKAPREIQDMCLCYLEPFIDESLVCTRALPPVWWRDALFRGGIIPWLWDCEFPSLSSPAALAMLS